jgi:competence protein ComFC
MKHGFINRPTLILKPRHKLPYQHLKHRHERHIAASHFQVNQQVLAQRVLILDDDVVTTGSTLNAAALALKDSGAKSVCGFTIASAERGSIALV